MSFKEWLWSKMSGIKILDERVAKKGVISIYIHDEQEVEVIDFRDLETKGIVYEVFAGPDVDEEGLDVLEGEIHYLYL